MLVQSWTKENCMSAMSDIHLQVSELIVERKETDEQIANSLRIPERWVKEMREEIERVNICEQI